MWKPLLLFLVLAFAPSIHASPCLPLTDAEKVKIIAYLSKWIGAPETEKLEIESDEFVAGTCYRRLAVKGRTLGSSPFFLSPDQRFLSRALFDLTSNPAEEKRHADEEINKVLLSEPSPSRGSPTTPVTIVEFGDFECLFCKRFHEWAQSLVAEQVDFRLVFKHLPLEGHPWARDAAAFAVCADMQSGDAFWRLHDFFYANQSTLTAENLESRVIQGFADNSTIDSSRALNCVHSHQADARITKDMELASQFGVKATPTFFVNGVKGGGLKTIDDLRNLIQLAKDSR